MRAILFTPTRADLEEEPGSITKPAGHLAYYDPTPLTFLIQFGNISKPKKYNQEKPDRLSC